ncbi:MAG: hypothetical protein FJ293_15750 [Planctomycetes bacterium]|nr:hypothetical protein [Planctomycetota bacterium]
MRRRSGRVRGATSHGAAALLAVLVALAAAAASGGAGGDRVVLKSGRELVGTLISDGGHQVEFDDAQRGRLVLPRHLVRTVVRADQPAGLFAPLWLDEPSGAAPRQWVRHVPPRAGAPGSLATGIGRFFHEPTRTTLFLVGAVHVGDAAYYERLQDVLDSCDRVLFEGVGPRPGDAAPSEDDVARFDALFQLQLRLKDLLGLEFQRDGLDYDRSWWRNADVGVTALRAELDARGAALPTDSPLVRALLQMVLQGLDTGRLDADPRMRAMLKRQVAAVLATAEQLLAGQADALQSVLVEWRNDAALAVLDDEIADGRPGRWIALFYGAAHLADFADKLALRGFTYETMDWLEAWRLD